MAGLEGQKLGEFHILKRLGEGGMGQVYLAEQERLGRQVAVKVVRPPRPSSASDSEPPMLADAPQRFQREAFAIGKLDHPNILSVYDFGTERDLMYLVMPYVPDGSLFDAMRVGKRQRFTLPLDATQAAPLIFQAASALQYAHDRNIIHRDVKPENFLIRTERDGSPQLLLADFGLVKEYHPGSGTSTMPVGTADYVAPEQIEGRPLPASDQYALAVMTYELLTGRLPFTGSVADVALKHMRQPPPAPRSINPNIPKEIEEVILTALKKRPEERWPSIAQYARAYSEALKQLDHRRAGEHAIEEERTVMLPPNQQSSAQKSPPAVQAPAAQQRQAPPQQAPHPVQTAPRMPAPAPGYPPPVAQRPPAPQYPPQGYETQPYQQGRANMPPPPGSAQRPWTSAPANAAPPAQKSLSRPIMIVTAILVVLLIATGIAILAIANGKPHKGGAFTEQLVEQRIAHPARGNGQGLVVWLPSEEAVG